MKTMTRKQLGGPAAGNYQPKTWDDMATVMTKHVMDKHPDVGKSRLIHSHYRA